VKYISLFSGICSATVAWKRLGLKPLAFAEIEPFPAELLAQRYPGVPNLGDVSRVDWSPYRGKADVVVGGSPCQAFSVAGLRKSLEDPRGNLTLEYVRSVHTIRPRYAVWENVPGVLSTNDNAFGCFLGALVGSEEALMAPRGHRNRRSKWVQKWFAVAHDVPGKRRWRRHEMLIEWTAWSRVGVVAGPLGTACWRILDAQYFGLAQRRERVFVVFSPGNRVDPGEILLEWESMRRDSPPSRAQGKGVTHGVARGAGSGSEWPAEISPPLNTSWADRSAGSQAQEWDSEKGGRFVPQAFGGNNTGGAINVATACRAKGATGHGDFESETFVVYTTGCPSPGAHPGGFNGQDAHGGMLVAHSLRANGFDASEDGTGRGTPLVPVANTLKANNGGGGFGSDPNETFVPMAFHGTQDPCANYGDTAPTIGCNQGQEACIAYNLRGREGGAMPEPADVASVRAASGGSSRTYVGVRRLTPTECERLQGFPDGYTLIDWRYGKPASDGPRYKALGNSMAVPVMAWLARRIIAAEGGER